MQNKPNSLTDKTNATSYARKGYTNIPLRFAPKNKPKQSQSSNAIRDTQHAIRKPNPNEPNFKMGKMTISTARTKAYAKEQRTMSNERYPKQTQSNPIPPPATPFFAPKWLCQPVLPASNQLTSPTLKLLQAYSTSETESQLARRHQDTGNRGQKAGTTRGCQRRRLW